MWNILKAEFAYYRPNILQLFVFTLGFYLYQLWSERPAVNVFAALTIYVLIGAMIASRIKEKRERQHALLPIRIKMIALSRIMLIAIPAVSLHVLFLIIHILYFENSMSWRESRTELIMLLGLTLFGFSVYFLLRDTSDEIRRKELNLAKVVASLIFGGIAVLFAISIAEVFQGDMAGGRTLLVLLLLCSFLLMAMTIRTFERRSSYAE